MITKYNIALKVLSNLLATSTNSLLYLYPINSVITIGKPNIIKP